MRRLLCHNSKHNAIKGMFMRHFTSLLFCLVFCATLLAACSQESDEKPTGVIPEHQLKAMEDAKKTEELMKKKLEEMDEAVEEAVDN
jgi:hypothetical protein